MLELEETVDEEILRKGREYWKQKITSENYEQILNPFKKEQKSKSKLLLIC